MRRDILRPADTSVGSKGRDKTVQSDLWRTYGLVTLPVAGVMKLHMYCSFLTKYNFIRNIDDPYSIIERAEYNPHISRRPKTALQLYNN